MAPVIVSGGLIVSSVFAETLSAGPLPITETWTVHDAPATLDGDWDWDDFIGSHGWKVATQAAELTNAGSAAQGGRLNADLGTDDYQAVATITEYDPDVVGLLSIGPCTRMQGTSVQTFYRAVVVSTGGGAPVVILASVVAGTETQLSPTVPVTVTLPATLALRSVGNQHRVFFNSAPVITVTDASIPTGRFAGIQGVASGLNLGRITTLAVTAAVGSLVIPPDLLTLTPMAA